MDGSEKVLFFSNLLRFFQNTTHQGGCWYVCIIFIKIASHTDWSWQNFTTWHRIAQCYIYIMDEKQQFKLKHHVFMPNGQKSHGDRGWWRQLFMNANVKRQVLFNVIQRLRRWKSKSRKQKLLYEEYINMAECRSSWWTETSQIDSILVLCRKKCPWHVSDNHRQHCFLLHEIFKKVEVEFINILALN